LARTSRGFIKKCYFMISVIIPVYNNYKTLGPCLSSVVRQTWQDIEVIVVDDGSLYSEKIRKIVAKFPNVKLIRQSNKGAPAARNKGFTESKGEYLLFLDADIILQEKALEKMIKKLSSSEASFCYSAFRLGWKKYKLVEYDYEKLKQFNYIHTSALIKRQFFPGFDESLKKFQDWDLWLT